jgi:class 3 adenylate cyclase
MLSAFVLVAVTVRLQWHEERFAGVYLDETLSGTREVSVLFADLQGFTTFSEAHEPSEVAAMLNAYYDVAVPAVVRRHGGDVDRFVGDAVMVTFNRRGDQPDHARRAAAAALDLQEETGRVSAAHPGWPRFRVGVNTGRAQVGVLGAAGGRTHTVIGDTVNVASRLEAAAPPGGVLVGTDTAARLTGARLEPVGALALKGRAATEEAYVLHTLDEGRRPADG